MLPEDLVPERKRLKKDEKVAEQTELLDLVPSQLVLKEVEQIFLSWYPADLAFSPDLN